VATIIEVAAESTQEPPVFAGDQSAAKSTTGKPPRLPFKRFNWAAFLFTWIWAAFNGAFNTPVIVLTVLSFVPCVGFLSGPVLSLYLGFKGNEISWRLKHWNSFGQFVEAQRKWNRLAVIAVVTTLAFLAVVWLSGIFDIPQAK
jgi:hypothetical protein